LLRRVRQGPHAAATACRVMQVRCVWPWVANSWRRLWWRDDAMRSDAGDEGGSRCLDSRLDPRSAARQHCRAQSHCRSAPLGCKGQRRCCSLGPLLGPARANSCCSCWARPTTIGGSARRAGGDTGEASREGEEGRGQWTEVVGGGEPCLGRYLRWTWTSRARRDPCHACKLPGIPGGSGGTKKYNHDGAATPLGQLKVEQTRSAQSNFYGSDTKAPDGPSVSINRPHDSIGQHADNELGSDMPAKAAARKAEDDRGDLAA